MTNPAPYGPPPAAPYPPPPAKKRNTTLIVLSSIAAIVALCCIGGITIIATSDTDNTAGSSSNDGSSSQKEQAAPSIGQPARDGQFEFVVNKVTCGKTQLGTSDFGAKAQGVFCLVNVAVTNIGKEPRSFSGSNQRAFAATGAEYSNSTDAEIYANDHSETFLNEINPGNKVKGVIVFDVPKGTKLTKLELHDSAFSGGVTVRLP